MERSVQYSLSEEEVEEFKEGEPDEREQQIQQIFEDLGEGRHTELLAGFCTGPRETYNDDPMVMGVSFDDDSSGTIDVAFTGSAYYGCKDMDRLDEHDESVAFKFCCDSASLTFTTDPPDPPERDTDDL